MGVYKSSDDGLTWERVSGWGDGAAGAVAHHKSKIYLAVKDSGNKLNIVKSADNGLTWESTQFDLTTFDGIVTDISWLFSIPEYLFITVANIGTYRYQIPQPEIETFRFLNPPWDMQNQQELIEKIYSFFDHEYPLLGYPYHTEPANTGNTTLNFLGDRNTQPYMYYSSHDGYDFSLRESTPVLASAGGIAHYEFQPNGLGHSITIDHQNGYQTIYGHMQSSGLIAGTNDVMVNTGDVIGFVGNSGNSTGPHLHFAVTKTGSPSARVDPYAWQAEIFSAGPKPDPWENYAWTDQTGPHTGSKSPYLWNTTTNTVTKYISPVEQSTLALGNRNLIMDKDTSYGGFTIYISPGFTPRVTDALLSYIAGTSTIINAYENLGGPIAAFLKPITIEIDLTNANLDDVKQNTLSIYFWNDSTQRWEALQSFFNLDDKKITAQTFHFSHFAVMGEVKNAFEDAAAVKNATFTVQ